LRARIEAKRRGERARDGEIRKAEREDCKRVDGFAEHCASCSIGKRENKIADANMQTLANDHKRGMPRPGDKAKRTKGVTSFLNN
jgi:hypothetical protein